MKHAIAKRMMGILLALVMLVGMMPMQVFATEEAQVTDTPIGEAENSDDWGTWVAFGTSITEDKDYMRPGAKVYGTYIPYLSERMGVTAPDANYSIAGAGFSTHLLMYMYYAKYQKNGLTYNGYTHTAIKNADLITIEGGVNDFYASVPLGKVGDTVPYSKAEPISVNPNSTNNFGGTTDGTFAGCIYAAIVELKRIAPDATIVFITDNAGTASCAATKANSLGHYLYDYNDIMIEVAESMGCYAIDAGRTAGFEENLATYLSDHINHSEAGGQAYANAIWERLCAIRNNNAHTHAYTPTVAAPTCTEQGYTTYTCACGDSYVSDYTEAIGHSYAEGVCTACGEADPNDAPSGWGTWVAFGTSITEDKDYMRPGAGNIKGTYIPYLSALMGVDAPDANYSIGGAAFSTHLLMYMYYAKYQKNGLTYNGYTHTAIKNADLITIEGGVNDFYASVPLGEVGDTVPYSKAEPISENPNSTNNFGGTTEGTFAGCIYAAITELKRIAPDATIVFITDNAGTGSCAATKANALGYYVHDYNDVMMAVAESMGCYAIDAGRTAGFEENLNTYLSDHIHHSEAGGQAYANAIWQGLCAIRNNNAHTHSYTPIVTAPTCTEAGYTTYTCACGDSYVEDYVAAEGAHDFTDWYTTKEAAYNADGEESRDCKKCSHVEFRSVKLEVITSGNVGKGTPYTDDVTYTLYADGTMVIAGNGTVYCSDWRGDYQPYKDYRTQVKVLIVEEGIVATSGGCFAHFYNLETVSLPDSLTKIDGNAFMSSFLQSITSVVIPKTVTYIGAYSYGFYYGKGGTTFTDIIVENPNVRFVDNKAVFNSGNNLENLTLYSYGANNNVSAYAKKYGCKYVDLDVYKTGIYSGVEYMYYDGVLTLSAAQTDATIAGEDAPWNAEKNNVTKIVIESGVTGISANAFKDYCHLESIEINNEIRHIGDGAFSTTETCDRALNLALPRTVKSVGSAIFAGRQNVTLTAYLGSAAAEINEPGVTLHLKKRFEVLLIGNSYSEDASNCGQGMQDSQLLNILQAMLGEDAEVTVALLSSGGKGINWHATQAEQGNAAYSFKIISSNSPTWTTIGSASSYQALTWTDWDVVSLQPYNISASTGIEAVPYPDGTDMKFRDLKTASEFLLDYVGTHAPDADIYCYMHWSQTTGTTLNANLSHYNKFAAQYLGMMEHAGTTTGTKYTSLIPVGLSIQNARSTYLALLAYNIDASLNLTTDTQMGLQRDGGHLSFNVGRYIAALTFAEMLIPAEMRADNYVLPDIRITESVGQLPKEYSIIAQKSVHAAVESWKNGSLAVTDIVGYTEDPTVAAGKTLEGMSFALHCDTAERLAAQLSTAVLAALPADFAVDAVDLDEAKQTATVTIRFGYTSLVVNVGYAIATHDYESVVTAPTCTEQGYTTYICACGDSYVDAYTSAVGHLFGSWVVTTQPTCTAIGSQRRECDHCDHYETETVVALGHDEITHEAKAPTCTEIGWDAYETCSRCDYTTYAVIPATGHSYKSVVTAPTCTEQGYTTYTCACGDTYVDAFTSALGHLFGSWVVTTQPTCTAIGSQRRECDRCDHYETETVAALGHNLTQHEAKAPTCTEIGWDAYETCSRCDYTTYAVIPATGHTYTYVVIAPTCGEAGYLVYTCRCGSSFTQPFGEATGKHTYDHAYDADCNACGGVRETDIPISFGGNSVSEDVSGLAFRFDVMVEDMAMDGTTAIYDDATVGGYRLLAMGAIVTNGVESIDIPAVYLWDLQDTTATFAVRVIAIPTNQYDTLLTATPYIVLEIGGVATIIYGEAQTCSYNDVNN